MDKYLYFNTVSLSYSYTRSNLKSTGLAHSVRENKKIMYIAVKAQLGYIPGIFTMESMLYAIYLLSALFILSHFILPPIL